VWLLCVGAAIAHNVRVYRAAFTKKVTAPTQAQEAEPKTVLSTKRLRELEALADARADELLAALGMD